MKTLKEAYKDYFTVGAAVNARWLDEAAETVKAHFGTITAENEMKYNGIHNHDYPKPDFKKFKKGERPDPPEITNRERFIHPTLETNIAPAKKIYDFAMQNGILIRGHALSWHASYPWGIFEQLTAEELDINTTEHYEYVSKLFPDCYCWDVVNEAVSDKPDGGALRRTVYMDKFGDDYLFKMYALARKYFPKAELCCNDYNEYVPLKRERILNLVKSLKERELVDVIGCQCHVNVNLKEKGYDEIKRTYDAYAETGLKIHVTEMDVNCVDWDADAPGVITPEAIAKVADVYEKLFEIFRQYKGAIENVTMWGVSNKHSWLNTFKLKGAEVKNHALLFDDEYQPTEALKRIVEF